VGTPRGQGGPGGQPMTQRTPSGFRQVTFRR
jgi:hypothetical protein